MRWATTCRHDVDVDELTADDAFGSSSSGEFDDFDIEDLECHQVEFRSPGNWRTGTECVPEEEWLKFEIGADIRPHPIKQRSVTAQRWRPLTTSDPLWQPTTTLRKVCLAPSPVEAKATAVTSSNAEPPPASSAGNTASGSVVGLRVALAVMAFFTIACGLPTMNVVPELQYLGDMNPPMDDMHRSAVLFLVAAAVAFPVYALAAVHVGFTGRGRAYLTLAAVAFAVQAVLNLIAQPFFGIIAMIPVAAGGIAAVITSGRAEDRLARPNSPKLHLWPDLVILPTAVALSAASIAHLNREYVPAEPNPPRAFDSSEGWERLGGVVDASIPVMEDVEGFRVSRGPYFADLGICDDGAAWNEEWVDLQISYQFGELEPGSETNLAYMAVLKESWVTAGYTITTDSSAEAATGDSSEGYGVAAARDDGITVAYRVVREKAELEIRSGCILKVGEIDTVDPILGSNAVRSSKA